MQAEPKQRSSEELSLTQSLLIILSKGKRRTYAHIRLCNMIKVSLNT